MPRRSLCGSGMWSKTQSDSSVGVMIFDPCSHNPAGDSPWGRPWLDGSAVSLFLTHRQEEARHPLSPTPRQPVLASSPVGTS